MQLLFQVSILRSAKWHFSCHLSYRFSCKRLLDQNVNELESELSRMQMKPTHVLTQVLQLNLLKFNDFLPSFSYFPTSLASNFLAPTPFGHLTIAFACFGCDRVVFFKVAFQIGLSQLHSESHSGCIKLEVESHSVDKINSCLMLLSKTADRK